MKLTEMKQVLAAGGIRLSKSLGQNFLHDANQLRRIVAAADLTKADRVLEIGPGLGPLTEMLLEQAGEVLAIEKDARLVEVLKRRFDAGEACRPTLSGDGTGGRPALQLVLDDALDYVQHDARDWSEWKLVANLPYSVASPILVELAAGGGASSRAQTFSGNAARGDARPPEPLRRGPRRIVVTLQIEVAKRLLAKVGTHEYGLLTLLVQREYEPRESFRIPASCFFPEPDVDSACICLVRRNEPLLPPEERDGFARIVKRSFSQRRKMMLKLLKEDWPEERLVEAFQRLKLSPRIRAEEVSLEQFTQMARALFGNPK